MFACSSVEFCLQHLIYRRLKRAARKGVRRGVKFHKAFLGMHSTDSQCSSAAPAAPALVPSHSLKSRQLKHLSRSETMPSEFYQPCAKVITSNFFSFIMQVGEGLGENRRRGENSFLLVGSEGVDDKALRIERTNEQGAGCRNVAASRHKSFFCNVLRAAGIKKLLADLVTRHRSKSGTECLPGACRGNICLMNLERGWGQHVGSMFLL